MKPSVIDVFSGAGLFSQGFKAAGFEPILAVELDHHAVGSYNRNIGDVAVCADIMDLRNIPPADVLIAGPPCQGFSTLGRRDVADARNNLGVLIPELANAAGALVAIVENVPPFLRSNQWSEMAERFRFGGFSVQTWLLDAANFATPQVRKRAFTVASKIGIISHPVVVSDVIPSGCVFHDADANDPLHIWPTPSRLAESRMSLIPIGGDKRDVLKMAPTLCPPSWTKLGAQATDVWGRIDPRYPSNTLRCRFQNPSTGRYIHPIENRVLSLREGARLQGVPDSWHFVGSPTSVARQIGNGVPVPLATAVASSVYNALGSLMRMAA